MSDNANSHNSTKRYPPELKERAVRMVFEAIEQTGERQGCLLYTSPSPRDCS